MRRPSGEALFVRGGETWPRNRSLFRRTTATPHEPRLSGRRVCRPASVGSLKLAPTHKAVRAYYDDLAKLAAVGAKHEGAVREAFGALLRSCAAQFGWTLVGEHPYQRRGRNAAKN